VTYRTVARFSRRRSERVFLQFGKWAGSCLRLLVNGRVAGVLGWPPYELDITDCLEGDTALAEIAVEVFGHRRNSHGPLHLAEANPVWTGPEEFVPEGSDYRAAHHIRAVGLMENPVIKYVKEAKASPSHPRREKKGP